jgi:hypothetical protein
MDRFDRRSALRALGCVRTYAAWALLVAAGLGFSAEAKRVRHPYRSYLDANRAEEIFAGIVLEPRLYEDRWLDIIGDRRDQEYTVGPGDTLWDISAREFGNPRLWRKLWEVNSFLTNPHEISTGQLLKYYRESGPGEAPIPLVHLVPPGRGFTDLDNDAFISRSFVNRYSPDLLTVRDDEVLGEIRGSYREGVYLTIDDKVYLTFARPREVQVGNRYAVIRLVRALGRAPGGRLPLGNLVRVVGTVRVTAIGDKLFEGLLESQRDTIERGDGLVTLPGPFPAERPIFNPPKELSLRVLESDEERMLGYKEGEVLILDKGARDGVELGLVFRVFADVDPQTQRRDDVEPISKGDVQIINVSEGRSLGYILSAKLPIAKGDTLIPQQAFPEPDPESRPRAPIVEIED